MRTMKNWMRSAAALVACLSVSPALAQGRGHGGGGTHAASPVGGHSSGGHWNGGSAGHSSGGSAGHWNGGSAGHWNGGSAGHWNGGSAGRWNGGSVGHWNGGSAARWNGVPSRVYVGRGTDSGWRRGQWTHVEHGGRYGWWWVVGPSWYPYSGPVYPYPAYGAWGAPPVQDWYYCPTYQAYYPDVTQCPEGWMLVQR